MIESGKLLGANPWQVFWKISSPLARPAVAAGVLVTLMETLADFGVAAQLASILVLIAFFSDLF